MDRETQRLHNITCTIARLNFEEANKIAVSRYRLDYCKALVIEYDRYIALQSYNTIVAIYDKLTSTMYDVLRDVYGYTATSAKHIAKFINKMKPLSVYTFRDVQPLHHA